MVRKKTSKANNQIRSAYDDIAGLWHLQTLCLAAVHLFDCRPITPTKRRVIGWQTMKTSRECTQNYNRDCQMS